MLHRLPKAACSAPLTRCWRRNFLHSFCALPALVSGCSNSGAVPAESAATATVSTAAIPVYCNCHTTPEVPTLTSMDDDERYSLFVHDPEAPILRNEHGIGQISNPATQQAAQRILELGGTVYVKRGRVVYVDLFGHVDTFESDTDGPQPYALSDLAVLCDLPNVQWMTICVDTRYKSSLMCLRHLPRLKRLEIRSRDGIVHEPKMQPTATHDVGVTSADLKCLCSLKTLENLDVSELPIEDLTWLECFPNLVTLEMSGTKVDDSSLPDLLAHPRLRRVGHAGTQLSAEGEITIEAEMQYRNSPYYREQEASQVP